ncbi:DUF2975 domain-containing protein [Arenibacter sp. GZD-96]|uniref:DUF2975 domain-containing protein n=1 Tax=Aurantibrevibacter litoralis TaxID=3106030 RepID=UPI003A4D4E79
MGKFQIESGRYYIRIPFTNSSIHGDYQFNVILTVLIVLFFGAIFFYILSNIFKALGARIIFNKKSITNLHFFTILNLVVAPIVYLLIHFPIMEKTDYKDIHNLILHLIFGVIALFLTQIFKNGYKIQMENDLTI